MQPNPDYNLQDSDEIILKDIFKAAQYYFYFWPYFVVSLILAFTGGVLILRYSNNIYQTDAQVQIKKGDNDATSFLTQSTEALFNFDKVKVENDIAIITSNKLIGQVVDRLKLETRLYNQGRVKSSLINLDKYPVTIEITDEGLLKEFEFIVETNSDRSVIKLDSIALSLNKGKQFSSEFFNLWPKDNLFTQEGSYTISHVSRQKAIENLLSNLEVTAASKDGEVVNLTYKGPNKDINESILNTLIQVLKEDQVSDKRAISEVSIEFIDDRLKGLTQSIDTISEKTIAFQSASGVFDQDFRRGMR